MYDNYSDIERKLGGKVPFVGNTTHAFYLPDSRKYVVFSYEECIYKSDAITGKVYFDYRKFSRTTTRIQNMIKNSLLQFIDINERKEYFINYPDRERSNSFDF